MVAWRALVTVSSEPMGGLLFAGPCSEDDIVRWGRLAELVPLTSRYFAAGAIAASVGSGIFREEHRQNRTFAIAERSNAAAQLQTRIECAEESPISSSRVKEARDKTC